jgi:hypothetical protein
MSQSKQTRRSISVRGTTYDSLRRYCDGADRSMSDVVEEMLAKLLTGKPINVKNPSRGRSTVANKVVRAEVDELAGRPAPVDARDVIAPRVSAPKGDYRVIDF